jgi:hypothetical protein
VLSRRRRVARRSNRPTLCKSRLSPPCHDAPGAEERWPREARPDRGWPRRAHTQGAVVPPVAPPWSALLVPTILMERRMVQGCAQEFSHHNHLSPPYIRRGGSHTHNTYHTPLAQESSSLPLHLFFSLG